VLATVFPDFARYNRDTPDRTGLRLAPDVSSYFANEGPDIVGVYTALGRRHHADGDLGPAYPRVLAPL
jgi:hypothetical protein